MKELKEILSLAGITKRWTIAILCIYFTLLFHYHLHSYTITWFIVSFTGSFIIKINKVSELLFKEKNIVTEVISLPVAFFLTLIPSLILGLYANKISLHTILYSFIACSIITTICFFINKIISIKLPEELHLFVLLVTLIITAYILCIVDLSIYQVFE